MNRFYCLYLHVFPNGKLYVGITKDIKARWRASGYYYKNQPKIWRAICKYGWDNIEHIVAKDGMTREEAEDAERKMIAVLGTIENGYNTAMGGGTLNGSYLLPYLHKMVNAGKKLGNYFANLVYGERKNAANSAYWNEATQAVLQKHGQFSPTDEWDVAEFWYHVGQWHNLNEALNRGENCALWRECSYEQAIYDFIMGGKNDRRKEQAYGVQAQRLY